MLPALRESDDVYVSNLTPTQVSGRRRAARSHSRPRRRPRAGRDTFLFLRGWIYPTDASINVALSQQSAIKLASPSLEVRDANGKWRTAIANIGFPSGKDKTIVIDLAGKFPTADHHVRIRTNMQIYWDQAFVARDLGEQRGEDHDAGAGLGRPSFRAASPACIARVAATGRTGSRTTT